MSTKDCKKQKNWLVKNLYYNKITYDETGPHGTVSYSNLEAGHLQIVIIEYNGKILEPKLMAISTLSHGGMWGPHWRTKEYIDLKTGLTPISYIDDNITLGENFTIVEEISLFDFIIEENWLQEEYKINELIKFYEEKVKNKLEEQEEIEESKLSRIKCQNI